MTLPVTVALATSLFVVNAVPVIEMLPSAMPKMSALLLADTLTTVLFVTCTPSSKPT